jgi:hypothetical protein
MFDRSNRSEGPLYVEIALTDGRDLRGRLLAQPGRSLTELLNGASAFIEFEPFGEKRTFLAKAALRSVTPLQLGPPPGLAVGDFDPFAVLGLSRTATREEAREAHLKLAKVYHPDRYAMTDLPVEVRAYLSAMAQRINAARDAVEAIHRKQAARPEPIFTTPDS